MKVTWLNAGSRAPRWLVAGLAVLILAGCSTTELVYNRLGFLARWEAGRYVSLTADQKALFKQHFAAAWSWHRREELPRLAASLRELAADLGQPVDPARLQAVSTAYGESWQRTLTALVPLACAVGPQLSDEQVEELLTEVDADIAETAEDAEDQDAARRAREVEKSLRSWFGKFDDAQRQLLEDWAKARPDVMPMWLAYRRTWRETLAAALAKRDSGTFCAETERLMVDASSLWTPEQRDAFTANRRQWLQLFATLLPTLSDKQQTHARERFLDLAGAFESLAAEAEPATMDEAI